MKPVLCSLLLALLVSSCASSPREEAADFNREVLTAMRAMPRGGGYSGSDETKNKLVAACEVGADGLRFEFARAQPSFCSSATYLVFLKATQESIQPRGELARALAVTRNQRDGHGVFGRWNANGPGAAKLVADLACGVNFVDWEKARPGDFLKIWWTDQIGARERGHHVVYLGHDAQSVRFWSSNLPGGYGEKSVPRQDCARVLFTRITNPSKIVNATRLPTVDPFLESMLREDFTWQQVATACRVR